MHYRTSKPSRFSLRRWGSSLCISCSQDLPKILPFRGPPPVISTRAPARRHPKPVPTLTMPMMHGHGVAWPLAWPHLAVHSYRWKAATLPPPRSTAGLSTPQLQVRKLQSELPVTRKPGFEAVGMPNAQHWTASVCPDMVCSRASSAGSVTS
jgi:hypothetical protein